MPATNKHATTFTTPTDTEVVVTRVFDAPAKLVFDAHTSCKHMPNWMGPYGWTMSECKNDLRPGGEFRYTWTKPGGSGITITGMNKEVDPPKRVVSTESWGEPWPVSTNTIELTEVGGQTTLVMTIRYPNKEARDTALGTGMKDGMNVGYERLDEYLGTLS